MKLDLAIISWIWQQKHKLLKKMDLIKIKYFCISKDTINSEKATHRMGENNLQIIYIYMELLQLNT